MAYSQGSSRGRICSYISAQPNQPVGCARLSLQRRVLQPAGQPLYVGLYIAYGIKYYSLWQINPLNQY